MSTDSSPLNVASLFLSFVFPTTIEGIVVVTGLLGLSIYTFIQSRQLRLNIAGLSTTLADIDKNVMPNILAHHAVLPLGNYGAVGATLQETWQHLRGLRKLPSVDTQVALNAVPLLHESTLARLRQRPNQLMLIGLLGTVLGLSITIGRFAPQLEQSLELLSSGQSPEALNESLGSLLRQMKVAFICTLWGVATSLIVTRWALIPTMEQRDNVQQTLEQLVIFKMLPVAWSEVGQRQDAILKALSANKDSLDRIHTTMAQQIHVFEKQNDRAAQIFTDAGRHLETVGLEAVRSAEEVSRTSKAAADVLQQVTETLQRSEAQLSATTTSLDANVTALHTQQRMYTETSEHILKTAGSHSRDLSTLVQSFMDTTSRLLDGLQDNLDGFETARAELVGHTTQVLEQQRRSGSEMTQTTAQLFTKVDDLFRNHHSAAELLRNDLQHVSTALQPLEELTQRLDPQLLPTERWQQFQQSLEQLADRWNAWQDTFAQRLDTLLDTNGVAIMAETRAQTQAMGQQLTDTTTKVSDEIHQAIGQWHSAYAQLAQHTTGTLQGQMSVAEQLQKQHDETRRDFHRITDSLQGLVTELNKLTEREQTTTIAQSERPVRESQPYRFIGDDLPETASLGRTGRDGTQK